MTATFTIWGMLARKSLARADEMVGLLIQPVLWLLLFGIGMRGFLGGTGQPFSGQPGSYLTALLPGIIALTAMSGATAGGLGWLMERVKGLEREYVAAPIMRLSVLGGHTLAVVSSVSIQTVIVLGIGLLSGAVLEAGLGAALAGALLLGAFIVGFSGVGLAFASLTSDAVAYHMMISLFNLPLLFLSDALYPLRTMPVWMRVASSINPFTYLVNGLRATWFGAGSESVALWISAVILGAFALFGTLIALGAFLRSIKR